MFEELAKAVIAGYVMGKLTISERRQVLQEMLARPVTLSFKMSPALSMGEWRGFYGTNDADS